MVGNMPCNAGDSGLSASLCHEACLPPFFRREKELMNTRTGEMALGRDSLLYLQLCLTPGTSLFSCCPSPSVVIDSRCCTVLLPTTLERSYPSLPWSVGLLARLPRLTGPADLLSHAHLSFPAEPYSTPTSLNMTPGDCPCFSPFGTQTPIPPHTPKLQINCARPSPQRTGPGGTQDPPARPRGKATLGESPIAVCSLRFLTCSLEGIMHMVKIQG